MMPVPVVTRGESIKKRTMELFVQLQIFRQLCEQKSNPAGDEISGMVKEIKEEIAKLNLPLVKYLVERILGRMITSPFTLPLEADDLVQEGSLALYEAIDTFQLDREKAFATYAMKCMWGRIIRNIQNSGHLIRIPVHIQDDWGKIKKAEAKFEQETGRRPSLEETAGITGIKKERINLVKKYVGLHFTLSLDKSLKGIEKEEDEELTLLNVLPCADDLEESLAQLNKEIVFKHVFAYLARLPRGKRDVKVLELRFGFKGAKPHTLDELGAVFGFTRERARQVLAKALNRLKDPKVKKIIGKYIEEFDH